MLETLIALFGATAIALPVTRMLGLGSILGYILAGVAIGPWGFHLVQGVGQIATVSSLGVVMLLFLHGLELRPHRLWIFRSTIASLGLGQVIPSIALLVGLAHWCGVAWPGAVVLGCGLALSSTAIVLPMLNERKLLSATSGRDAFAVLLFQDVVAIAMVSLVPLLASTRGIASVSWLTPAKGLIVIAAMLSGGIYLVPRLFKLVTRTGSSEVFSAAAMLLVVGSAALTAWAGLSMSLGAFMAGVMFSDSEYRHAIQTHIEPFKGLLLGFFFISIGASADVGLLGSAPGQIALSVLGLLVVKIGVSFAVGWAKRRNVRSALRFALALPEASEFSFVLFGVAAGLGILDQKAAAMATLVVTMSMIATPFLFAGNERFLMPLLEPRKDVRPVEPIKHAGAPVIICGFGRMGQIVGRMLSIQHISYTALDQDPKVIETVKRFGIKVYFGDPSKIDLIRAAGAADARVIVVTLNDPAAVLELCETIKRTFSHLTIVARAHDRNHAQMLMDVGVTHIVRETYFSSLRLSELVLTGLGLSEGEARRTVSTFRAHDERLLQETGSYHRDDATVVQTIDQATEELAQLLEADHIEPVN